MEKYSIIQSICPGYDLYEIDYDLFLRGISPLDDNTIAIVDDMLVSNYETVGFRIVLDLPYKEGIIESLGEETVDKIIKKLTYIEECKKMVQDPSSIPDIIKYKDDVVYDNKNPIYTGPNALQLFIGMCYIKQGIRRSNRKILNTTKYYNVLVVD